MMVIRFRDSYEHEELLKKVKKMKKFASEIEDCLEEHMEDSTDYREDYDDEDYPMKRMESRYARMRRSK
jgi:hypothetical protein